MKLIHTKLARSIWLFDIRDMNPRGKDVFADILDWVKEAYSFAVAPDPYGTVPASSASTAKSSQGTSRQAPGGYTFQRGRFQAREEVFIEVSELTIYDDGIVIDTASSTDDGDQFADDLLRTAAAEFALSYDTEMVRKRRYASELIVRSDLSLEALSPVLPKFSESISEAAQRTGCGLPFGVSGITFWSQPIEGGTQRTFSFERQAGRDFSERRYFSGAPMQTAVHLGLLKEFEKLVTGQ